LSAVTCPDLSRVLGPNTPKYHANNNNTPPRNFKLTLRQPIKWWTLNREATGAIFSVFGLHDPTEIRNTDLPNTDQMLCEVANNIEKVTFSK